MNNMEDFTKILKQGREQKSEEKKQEITQFQKKIKRYSSELGTKLKEFSYDQRY